MSETAPVEAPQPDGDDIEGGSDRPANPYIRRWVDEPNRRYSVWDPIVEEVRAEPGDQWAQIVRPRTWNSGFPAWFRKTYPDMELYVPHLAKDADGKIVFSDIYMRRKPLARGPLSEN